MPVEYPTNIDRNARLFNRNLLLKYMRGEISNYYVDDSWNYSDYDQSLHELFGLIEHFFYQCEKQTFQLSEQSFADKRLLFRCLVFLTSDSPYLWPSSGNLMKYKSFSIFFGFLQRKRKMRLKEAQDQFHSFGDINYWPFLCRRDFFAALRSCENNDPLFSKPRRWCMDKVEDEISTDLFRGGGGFEKSNP